jgi:hypothetical protein
MANKIEAEYHPMRQKVRYRSSIFGFAHTISDFQAALHHNLLPYDHSPFKIDSIIKPTQKIHP